MEIFVGNLPFQATEQDIKDAFSAYGEVGNVKMLTDRTSGRFRGMAFVSMNDEFQANTAIAALNGSDMGGRNIRVDQSRPRAESVRRFTGFGGAFKKEFKPRRKKFYSERSAFNEYSENDGFRHKKQPFHRTKYRASEYSDSE